jgi:hypothetical protein
VFSVGPLFDGTTTIAPEHLETTSTADEADLEADPEDEGATTENWRARGAKRRKKVVKGGRTTTTLAPGNKFYVRVGFDFLYFFVYIEHCAEHYFLTAF